MSKTTIHRLGEFGQSIWLDYISRSLIKNGRLKALIDLGLLGMTSNPTIFDQAISTSTDYDEKIARLGEAGKSPLEIYDELTIQDVRDAADAFFPVYQKTQQLDGYVSLEINPKLALDTEQSIREGLRLFQKTDRPNLMIKVPATKAGFPVIEELLLKGVNVNVTLIFSLAQYQKTTEAFFKGMKQLSQKRADLSSVWSVASVFVSRVDTAVDNLLDEKIKKEAGQKIKSELESLKGKAAAANAQLIFAEFGRRFKSDMFQSLSKKKCGVQRVLWASTGTKNPSYSDIKYVTELIGRPTVNTLPEKTITAFLNHGVVKEALSEDDGNAGGIVASLGRFGIDINRVCEKLLTEGVSAFEKSFDSLLSSIETKARSLCARS